MSMRTCRNFGPSARRCATGRWMPSSSTRAAPTLGLSRRSKAPSSQSPTARMPAAPWLALSIPGPARIQSVFRPGRDQRRVRMPPCTPTVLAYEHGGNAGSWQWLVPARDTLCRSEEHTSELQSLRHLVCRLLLEKKNKNDHRLGEHRSELLLHAPLSRVRDR